MDRKNVESILDTLAHSQETYRTLKMEYDRMTDDEKDMFSVLTERLNVGVTSLYSFLLG